MTTADHSVAALLISTLHRRGLTIGTAESLTGGLVCAALTDIPGASAVVRGGIVAYATDVKRDVLGVDAALLSREGAVHPDVAAAMAQGVRRVLACAVGLSTTGVAGPGAQDGQPAGSVFVAVALAGQTRVRHLRLTGDRAAVRAGSALDVLGLAQQVLDDIEVAGSS